MSITIKLVGMKLFGIEHEFEKLRVQFVFSKIKRQILRTVIVVNEIGCAPVCGAHPKMYDSMYIMCI